MKTAVQTLAELSNNTVDKIEDSEPIYFHQGEVIKFMKAYASQEKIAYNKELLDDILGAFQQACWIEDIGHYDHLEISTWKRIQRTLIEAGKIKAEECYRQV